MACVERRGGGREGRRREEEEGEGRGRQMAGASLKRKLSYWAPDVWRWKGEREGVAANWGTGRRSLFWCRLAVKKKCL